MNVTPSLRLGFGAKPTVVEMRSSDDRQSELVQLSFLIPGGRLRRPGLLEVDVDDLLSNLKSLASWPEPQGVLWEPTLRDLAATVSADAGFVRGRLQGTDIATTQQAAGDFDLGPSWRAQLAEFQKRDIAKLLALNHGANFSVPGAGKTRVALAVYAAKRLAGGVNRLLVVGPKSAYEAWLTENAECFSVPLRMQILDGVPDSTAEALVVNYERLDGSTTSLVRWLSAEPSMLVLDEAHRMKLGSSGTYGSACYSLGPYARRRLILTGTPVPNGVRDLENLMGFVWPGHGRRAVASAVAGGDLAHASDALRPLYTRTTKVELGLPKVTPRIRRLDLPPLHREIYNALIGQFTMRAVAVRDDFDALGKILAYLLMAATSPALLAAGATVHEPLRYRVPPLSVPPGADLSDLMRDLPGYEMSPKFQEAIAIVAKNAAEGRKTIVWSTFVRSILTLERLLGEFKPAVVHGGTLDRDEQIGRFRTDPSCSVLVSNPATLGEGISLHHVCHDAVYVDRDFAAGKYLQSLDRIHRLGLTPETQTNITILVADSTIDDVVTQRLDAKLDFMGRILDDPAVRELADLDEEASVGGELNEADLQALLGYLRGNATA